MRRSSTHPASPVQEREHPLRADPLNELPDAIRVPRARVAPSQRVATWPPSSSSSPSSSPSTRSVRASSELTRRSSQSLTQRAHELLHAYQEQPHDPLLLHLAHSVTTPQPPPAGDAYAADIHAVLADWDESGRETHSDGVMDRSDVTLFAAAAHTRMAAGVYIVRSRRNWAIVSTPTADDYYMVPRSIADFLWLHDSLSARNEGVIVPLLPPLNMAGRVKHGYAYEHERLRALETFLRTVATHAVLSTSDELLAFLGALGEDEWQKIRAESISRESSITSALFGSSDDENAWHRLTHWGEKMLWQTGRRFNKALVWFLQRDSLDTLVHDSAEARVERLHMYVKDLGVSLAFLRHTTEKVHKHREAERNGAVAMQNALRELGVREGGKLGSQLENVKLQIPAEGESQFAASWSRDMRSDRNGDVNDGERVVPANRVFGPHLDHGGSVQGSALDSKMHLRRVSSASHEKSRSTREGQTQGDGGGAEQSRNALKITLPVARVVDDVFRDYEERAKGAQRIMNARREEQDAYEHAVAVYTKLRDQLESRTGSMWDGRTEASNESLQGLKTEVHRAANRLKQIRERYKKVALSTTDELRRLRNDMHEDLCEALHGMAVEYARQHAAHAEAWKSLSQCVNEFRRSAKTNATSSPQGGSASRSRI